MKNESIFEEVETRFEDIIKELENNNTEILDTLSSRDRRLLLYYIRLKTLQESKEKQEEIIEKNRSK